MNQMEMDDIKTEVIAKIVFNDCFRILPVNFTGFVQFLFSAVLR